MRKDGRIRFGRISPPFFNRRKAMNEIYNQHAPKGISRDNVPGRALRAMLYHGSIGECPTYGDLQSTTRTRGYEVNNASAAISQLREIMLEHGFGTVGIFGRRPQSRLCFKGTYEQKLKFFAELERLNLPYDSAWSTFQYDRRMDGFSKGTGAWSVNCIRHGGPVGVPFWFSWPIGGKRQVLCDSCYSGMKRA